jgi:two-component system OmpR family response regulator
VARILLVEDDPALLRGLVATLRADGYAVDTASEGAAAISMGISQPYAVVVLDVGLPDVSGFDVLKKLREKGCRMPILVLTARDTVQDRITGLDLGADDYMLKPFEPSELEARIRALMRRSHGDPSPVVTIGNLVINRSLGTATIGDRVLELRRREWAVLERLVARAGKLVSKERLTDEVFGFDEPVAPNAVEVYIARLRKKLEPDGPTIRTLRGLGYLLDVS